MLHPTSLPSHFGIGDLGESAYRWIDLLVKSGHSLWQVCPLGPTGYGDSPYATLGACAGNPLLISPHQLVKDGFLSSDDLAGYPALAHNHVDYGAVIPAKERILRAAFDRFSPTPEFKIFCNEEKEWLDEYTLFLVVKALHLGKPWWEWDTAFKNRNTKALADVQKQHSREMEFHAFAQYLFFTQWAALKKYAAEQKISIMGDIPYYVAHDSSDVWTHPHLFEFDKELRPLRVAGVPPDYFSADGQLWGNPLYRWDVMKKDNFAWWNMRIGAAKMLVDIMRLDHFRGFESYWAVDAKSTTAKKGEWVKGPGKELFDVLFENFGRESFVAEDLGEITDDVLALLKKLNLPGMKVLQFAFDGNPENPYLPYNVPVESVLYTGTHDNATSCGWYDTLDHDTKSRVREYLGCDDHGFWDRLMRTAYGSNATLCVVPFQDVLRLGVHHRMNTPGSSQGNWQWRFTDEMVDRGLIEYVKECVRIFGRMPVTGVDGQK